jgi:hypothetical protein
MANRKEPFMKLSNLIWVLALAGAATACDTWTDQPPITNERPPVVGGSGGSAGSGGSGGISGDGACTDEADQAVYADLTYTDEDGVTYTGTEASSAIGSDCIFGTDTSDPVLPGCGDEAFAVVGCFPNCEQSVIDTLASCVAACTQDATGLSAECMGCTGETVACGAAFCTSQCVSDTNAQICIDCRCDNGCTPDFDTCSGLPSSGDCN